MDANNARVMNATLPRKIGIDRQLSTISASTTNSNFTKLLQLAFHGDVLLTHFVKISEIRVTPDPA